MKESFQSITVNGRQETSKVIDFNSYGREKGTIEINGVEYSAIKVYGSEQLEKILKSKK